ncbi:TPA: hypothetical protein UL931_000334 [Stenotrophomonas maltophilia]|nr:hypothetical protein [Stenotrophomonas maltophilia]
MKTNKTLADAQHGGCVQLPTSTSQGDANTIEKLRAMMDHSFGGPGFVVYGTAQSIAEVERRLAPTLSAQPSSGGQGDARALIQRYDAAGAKFRESLMEDHYSDAQRVEFRQELTTVQDELIAALAARQPMDSCTESECVRCRTHPDHRGEMGHAGISDFRQPVGEPIAEVVLVNGVRKLRVYPDEGLPSLLQFPVGTKFYTAPPALAVDLGPVRDVFRRWHANELNSTDAMLALVEALAVIDSQAVGNG